MLGVLQGAQPSKDELRERRAKKRFPIVTAVQYKVTNGRGEPKSGIGKTVNVSSVGVLFAAPEALRSGKQIELSISWPSRLDGKLALQLVVWGRITRCRGAYAAVGIDKHEFRIQSYQGLHIAVRPSLPQNGARAS